MENVNRLGAFLSLLEIRRKAYLRNAIIVGAVFGFALLASTVTLLLTDWNARTFWLMGLFDLILTISFVMAWVRYEIVKGHIELVKQLQLVVTG